MAVPAFQPKQQIIYFQGAKIMQTSTMKACFQNYRVQLILYKGTGHVCQMMSQVSTISQKSLYHLVPIVPGVAYGRMINSHHNNGSRPIS